MQILYIIQSIYGNPDVLKTCKGKRAVKAESFHLELLAKIPRLKKCKTKISDGQPFMYVYFDYVPLLAWVSAMSPRVANSPSERGEKAAEIQYNSFV